MQQHVAVYNYYTGVGCAAVAHECELWPDANETSGPLMTDLQYGQGSEAVCLLLHSLQLQWSIA